MIEPSAPADKSGCAPQRDLVLFLQPSLNFPCQPTNPEKTSGTDASHCRGKGVPNNIDLLRPGLQPFTTFFIWRQRLADLADFPAVLQSDVKLLLTEGHDLFDGLFEVGL